MSKGKTHGPCCQGSEYKGPSSSRHRSPKMKSVEPLGAKVVISYFYCKKKQRKIPGGKLKGRENTTTEKYQNSLIFGTQEVTEHCFLPKIIP